MAFQIRRLPPAGRGRSNELPSAKPRGLLALAWEVVREPMLLLLVGAGAIYLVLGELKDSRRSAGLHFAVLAISLYQQRKTERALEALRDLSSPASPGDSQWKRKAYRRTRSRSAGTSLCSKRETASLPMRGYFQRQPIGRRIPADRRVSPGTQISGNREHGDQPSRRRGHEFCLFGNDGRPRPWRCRSHGHWRSDGTRKDRKAW